MYNKTFKTNKFEFNIDDVLEIAKKAGEEVLKIYNKDFEVEYKDDKSPLTEADKLSHKIIVEGLNNLPIKTISSIDSIETIVSIFPILSEEGKNIPYEDRKDWEYFWMIDPLDGTKEFIKKNGEFTINIALIHKNTPIFGVVYSPILDWIYFNDNNNSYKIEKDKLIKLPIKRNNDKFIIVASRSHLNEETKRFIKSLTTDYDFISIGSSLKLCLVAEGKADIYPRLAPTMEWDTAAADAIVRKAGKMTYLINPINSIQAVISIDSINTIETIIYNKQNLLNPYFIVK